MNISVIGTGTWGIALANLLCVKGLKTSAWSALPDEIEYIKKYRKHPKLKDTEIEEEIYLSTDLKEIVEKSEVIVMAVPSIYVRSTAKKVAQFIKPLQIIVDVAKGIEANTLCTMSEIIFEEVHKVLNNFEYGNIVALSGPTHAEEVSIGLPSTIVSASINKDVAELIQDIFSTSYMRVYTNYDIKGVEICGSLKNIIALAAGISHGLEYGDNAIAALVTRGINEIARLGLTMGSPIHTFYGLAGLGDLVVTCTSKNSRNNQCGTYIGKGYSINDAITKVGMVVEGINALDAAHELSEKYNIELPIIDSVYKIVKNELEPKTAVENLFNRDKKEEIPFSILELLYQRKDFKNVKMKRVITYGTFDLLHYGHINFLRRAKELGDYLIVALSTDDFVKNEKQKQCYFNYEERKSLLEALKYVDLVIPENSWGQKIEDIKEYHIDSLVMSEDWKTKFDDLKEEGIDVIYLQRTPEISTTKIKDDLQN